MRLELISRCRIHIKLVEFRDNSPMLLVRILASQLRPRDSRQKCLSNSINDATIIWIEASNFPALLILSSRIFSPP